MPNRSEEGGELSEVTAFRVAAATACQCRFACSPHHDQLLRAPTDVAAALEVLELAVTWDELDYSGDAVILPTDWSEFVEQHDWQDPEIAQRLFGAAVDVALRRRPVAFTPRRPDISKEIL